MKQMKVLIARMILLEDAESRRIERYERLSDGGQKKVEETGIALSEEEIDASHKAALSVERGCDYARIRSLIQDLPEILESLELALSREGNDMTEALDPVWAVAEKLKKAGVEVPR